ncbi:DcaP family trimeric outer membrane transporter [Acinetobacter junii]|uniref:DcaP family trimeric outer membrane transporter n=2 Tax=Acinetobacter junii TaxID=40215 RepID=UPI000F672CA9|nr:DcaP family trimeric outer membrane transporter [Acinetobacter junii]MCE6004077.1 DcaP-like protein [Acinetobacter junii]MDA3509679.1 DcaP family trimeric outer membrane transporter [Acinetobacter junii]MDA3534247.1 DcaP family trimeric outer membrane transporter [Acinetobacter junii]MDH1859238.1 DcaP family trimeric outer membrane transporter [Acinetobacter junii]MDR7654401.1 DcaP family trimeric outer membrane transporter [Acinetobacter junii]
MSLPLIRKPFLIQGLAFTVAILMMNTTQAATEQEQIQQLRDEVKELRALLEQYVPHSKQKTTSPVLSSAQVLAAQTTTPSSDTNKKSPLSFQTASGADVKLYGFLRGDASYQAQGGDGIFNRINKVDLENNEKNSDRFYSTATVTRLGLDFKAPVQGADVGGKLEVDFRGGTNNDTIRIRHAYLTYNDWLFGQTTSTFLATDLQPEMLDFNSPLGIGTYRTPMVRYSGSLNPVTSYAIALEKGSDDNRAPAFSSKIKYDFAEGKGTTSARALLTEVRSKEAFDKDHQQLSANESDLGWGIALGAKYKFTDSLQAMLDYSHVKGDSKFLLYTNNAFNVNPTNYDLNLNEFDAVTVGTTYQITPKVRSTLAYGAMFAKDNNAFAQQALLDTAQNKTLQQGWLNVMFSPVTPITFGLEYIYGERKTFNGQKGKDNRVGAMARYNF